MQPGGQKPVTWNCLGRPPHLHKQMQLLQLFAEDAHGGEVTHAHLTEHHHVGLPPGQTQFAQPQIFYCWMIKFLRHLTMFCHLKIVLLDLC